ncbi:MAG: hypothetical protein ACR2RE_15190 [Geminicoccaceae bacterium]
MSAGVRQAVECEIAIVLADGRIAKGTLLAGHSLGGNGSATLDIGHTGGKPALALDEGRSGSRLARPLAAEGSKIGRRTSRDSGTFHAIATGQGTLEPLNELPDHGRGPEYSGYDFTDIVTH